MSLHVPEKLRILTGPLASTPEYGCNGAFIIPASPGRARLAVIVSDELGWEHVSVSAQGRCPFWDEMCVVKAMFWDPEDCVIQFHPPASDYVNQNPYCLHLWRNIHITALQLPPTWMVGSVKKARHEP